MNFQDILMQVILWITFIGLIVLLIFVLMRRIISVFKSYLKGYKTIDGKVVDHINISSEEYYDRERKKIKEGNPILYKFLSKLEEFSKSQGGVDKDEEPSYISVIQYVVNGKKYTIEDTIGTDTKSKKGTKVKIKYNPENPKEAILKKDFGSWLGIIVILFFILIIYMALFK